jgi:hypothetical protein
MQETATAGNLSRARARNNIWDTWQQFCIALGLPELLQQVDDPIPFLQVFARRYRDGRISRSGDAVRSRTVEEALRAIGRTFVLLGAENPRLTAAGHLDERISSQLAQWRKSDPAPSRVKPVPFSLLHHIDHVALTLGTEAQLCLADMMWIAVFFLCRPGEYTAATEGSTPFRFEDASLWIGGQRLDITTATPAQLLAATFSTLTFTDQKNAVRGEVIGQGCTGSARACATRSIARLLLHLRSNNAPPHTPLCAYFESGTWRQVTSPMITVALRSAAHLVGATVGFLPADVSCRSLRAGGAMAMLCARIDPLTIQLLGRWRSDAMLRYLHVQAAPLTNDIASRMLQGGQYQLLPNQAVPAIVPALEAEVVEIAFEAINPNEP